VKVILVRHGDAEAEVPEGMDDDSRVLTSRARLALPSHFVQLAPQLGPIDLIFTSPVVRAVQTSTLFATALRYPGPLKTHRHLYPDSAVGAVEAILREHLVPTIVLVGHQPTMGATAAHLLGLTTFSQPVNPGTVIALEWDRGPESARLLFAAAPPHPSPPG
jgi:phosphohistidine phosphatase